MNLLWNAIPALEKVRKGKFLFSLGRGMQQDYLQNTPLSFNSTNGNSHFHLSAIEHLVHEFYFCDLNHCLSKLSSWSSSSWHEHHSLYYAPAPLTLYLEDMREKNKHKVEPALIHLVQIKNFLLSDTTWDIFTFLWCFFAPHLLISPSLSLDLDGLPPSWRRLKVAALEIN